MCLLHFILQKPYKWNEKINYRHFISEYPLLIDRLTLLKQLLYYLKYGFVLFSKSVCFCRSCISDDLKIGCASRDHATQTDIKDIPELNELATATQALIKVN